MVETDLLYAFIKKEDWLKAVAETSFRESEEANSAQCTLHAKLTRDILCVKGGRNFS